MSTRLYLADPTDVGNLLSSLIGRSVTVKRLATCAAPRGAFVVGAYAHDDDTRAGIAWLDIPAAAGAAAGLTLMGAVVVDECVHGGRLFAPLDENVREVLNICARLFATPGGERVYLRDVHLPPGKLPADLTALLGRPPATLQLDVTIAGYRAGRMGLIAGPGRA
jgi:hypothetical protein